MSGSHNSLQGRYIIATSVLINTYFEAAIIFITEHNENGAIGYITNQPYPRRFNELVAFIDSPPVLLYEGGPVEHEKLFFIHRRKDLVSDSILVSDNIYIGGNFTNAVQLINTGNFPLSDFKLFIGYCGWDAGELEAEIAEGSWELTGGKLFD